MLRKAQEHHYAVGAFNVENMEMAQAIIGAAEYPVSSPRPGWAEQDLSLKHI